MKCECKEYAKVFILILVAVLFLLEIKVVISTPTGSEATSHGSSTKSTLSNASINESTDGGYIYTYSYIANEQNERWKAYVGNVSGSLVLDDANNYSIFEWDLGALTGEVYATRNDSSINWSGINCSWVVTGDPSDRTVSQNEDAAMQHSRFDNITATFSTRDHRAFQVGDIDIAANDCYSIYPYVNDTNQTDYFPEVILYDGSTTTNGNIVYAALIETDKPGYNTNSSHGFTYDFQMLVPEIGTDSWSSSTAYYFYVELS